MGFNLSTNMNLPVPQVGNEAGPQYAQDVNNCLTLVDAHNHSPGYGIQITPNGLNINTDLPINSNNLTLVRTLRLASQGAPLTGVSDIGCIYEVVNDLYFNDGLGNNIRLTQAGAVAGTSGSISGLVPPASAAYVSVSNTFVWQSNTNVAANLDARSIILRTNAVSSPGLTLSPPPTIGSDYSISFPVLPGSNLPVSIDNTGTMSAAQISLAQVDSTITSRLTTQIVYMKDVKPSGVRGGTFVSGSYITRELNTLENSNSYPWVALASNQFTLQAGTYDIQASAMAGFVDFHKARIQNITDATTVSLGMSSYSSTELNVETLALVNGTVTIASAKVFEIQHQCATTSSGNNGLGEACSFGDNELYVTVRVEKVFP